VFRCSVFRNDAVPVFRCSWFYHWSEIGWATPELGGGRRGSRPRCLLPGGARGAKVPFQFKGLPWWNSELSEMLVQLFYEFASENARNAVIELQEWHNTWWRTPSHPYHPINGKRIRRSSTPDVLQTSLSIYQLVKSTLSRKSAPLAFTSFRRPWIGFS
jgi:hypothetical protein